jgi:hypothetical protein
MGATLITFANIRKRTDIIGGQIEFPGRHGIMRGKIEDIDWWSTHPSDIEWVDGTVWNPRLPSWDPMARPDMILFPIEEREGFGGPYETDSGEIFFLCRQYRYITLYPIGLEPHEIPYDDHACFEAHCRIMGFDRRGKAFM